MITKNYECNPKPSGDRLYPPYFFEVDDHDKYLIQSYAEQLRGLYANYSPAQAEDTSNASEQYRELNEWNRDLHNELVASLEPVYLGLADRVASFAIDHQYQLEQECRDVTLAQIPYAIAALPPNLFDHLEDGPFLPATDEDMIKLVSEYVFFNRRLAYLGMPHRRIMGHSHMDSAVWQGFDVLLELQRRRYEGDQMFATESGQEAWRRYNEEFKRFRTGPLLINLSSNAAYIAYSKNRKFTEAGGFFDLADGMFESFYLTNLDSRGAFTSQIRAPIGWYGHDAAKELALGTHMMLGLMSKDEQFNAEVKRIAHSNDTRILHLRHLMRSRDFVTGGDQVEYGIKQTSFEGLHSVAAAFSAIEADGIPGYETDLWEGIAAALDDDVLVQIASGAPQAVVVPPTLHGNYFKDLLVNKNEHFRLRPEVSDAWHEIHQRRTVTQHTAWETYRQSGEGVPPVRFGLHCPFKGKVVKHMAETLTICRAIAHDAA